MKDRIPTYPGRVKLVPVAGQANVYDMVRADEPTDVGTPLNKATLLSDETAVKFGLEPAAATPNDAFNQILPLYPKIGKIMRTFGDAPDNHWIKLVNGTTYFTAKTPELYDAIKVDELSTTEVQDLGSTTLISTHPISMGYMNGYWYDLADNNYDNKLVFKEDAEGSSWNKVTEADFNIPEDERTRLYYTRDLIYFDGKYFISGSGTIFESVDLKKWTISSRVFDTGEHNGIICDHFHLTPDKTILYGCFTGNSQSRVVWRELGGTWNVTDSVNMSIYDVFMRPDKTMIAFGTECVYTSTSISDTNYTKLCTIGRNINYIEYINDLKCYITSHRESGYTMYSVIEEFTKDTSSSSFNRILTDYRYPENPNVFYDSFNKIIWTLGNTSTNADESYVYYVEAATLEELKANAYKQISDVISVDYMYLARVRPKNNQVIFVKRTYSSGNSAYYSLREFAKSVTIQDREPTYILAYDLRKPAPTDKLNFLREPQTDDVYTELATAIREGVNSI